MKANQFNNLITAKGETCISVILPTLRVAPERQQNKEIIRKAMTKVKAFMEHGKVSSQNKELLLTSLTSLAEDLDTTHLLDGVGLFVSADIAERVLFPFPVTEKIVIDDSFEIRDLLNLKQFLSPYYVLMMGKKIIRLFKAEGETLEEIRGDHFPVELEEEYEYAPPSPGTSYGQTLKAYEKDKGILSTIRLRSNLKRVDDALTPYLTEPDGKIILVGTKIITTDFENLTTHGKFIAAKIDGGLRDRNFSELALATWSAYVDSVTEENNQLLLKLDERKSNDVVYGIRNVWKASNEGRGLVLFVEKDYRQPAYVSDSGEIDLSPQQNYTPVLDAVGDIVESVYRKNGKVVFVHKDKLSKYDKIALLLRY